MLDYEPEAAREIDPLMGWTSSRDMKSQLRLSFETKEEAVAYAERNGIPYRLLEPEPRASVRKVLFGQFPASARVCGRAGWPDAGADRFSAWRIFHFLTRDGSERRETEQGGDEQLLVPGGGSREMVRADRRSPPSAAMQVVVFCLGRGDMLSGPAPAEAIAKVPGMMPTNVAKT